MSRLPSSFFDRDTLVVAKELIGCRLVRELNGVRLVGKIVETEAYDGPNDRASHASKRKTARNAVMFGPPAYTYVYLIYGMHHCLNFVTGPKDYPAAVLIRALDPIMNIEPSTQGPGRLCKALEIDRTMSGLKLGDPGCPVWVESSMERVSIIETSPRIGVDYSGEWADKPYRFFETDNRWVSRVPKRKRKAVSTLADLR